MASGGGSRSYFWAFLAIVIYHLYQVHILHSFDDDCGGVTGTSGIDRSPESPSSSIRALVNQRNQVQPHIPILSDFIPVDPADAVRKNYSCTRQNLTYVVPQTPGFIIIGTQKGGTSALSALLDHHPWIESSYYFEPHFFDHNDVMLYYKHRMDEPEAACKVLRTYMQKNFNLKRLRKYPNLMAFEKTPAYILTPGAPERIKKTVPWAKMVITLRNPVDRLISQHKMTVMRKWENRSFHDTLAADVNVMRHSGFWVPSDDPFNSTKLDPPTGSELRKFKTEGMLYRGCYARQILPWLEYYKHGVDLHVVRYEEMRRDPNRILNDLLYFVGAPNYDFPGDVLNKSYSPKGKAWISYDPEVSDESLDFLKRFYKPYNDELADMLGEQWRGVWD